MGRENFFTGDFMSNSRIAFCVLLITFALSICSLAQNPTLDVKTGLWETTITMQASGMPAMPNIPPDALARMTPDQQAKVKAMMSGMSGQPTTVRNCITKEKLAKGFRPDSAGDHSNCKQNVVSTSPTAMDMTVSCTEEHGNVNGTFHMEAVGHDAMSGSSHIVSVNNGRTITMDGRIQGKYLGPDCGDVK